TCNLLKKRDFCRSGPGGVPFFREKAGTSDAYAVAEILHSRTSPLPRRPVFAARQRYVEDVLAPPTKLRFFSGLQIVW
ncbi:hypothetical protein, partial [Pseudomonas viridiflava]